MITLFAAGAAGSLSSHQFLIFLLQIALLLVTAFFLGALARRFKLPTIVGELSAGLVLGPSILGNLFPEFWQWIFPSDALQFQLLHALGQLGVVMLVALSGIEINLALLRRRSTTTLRVSAFGLVVPFFAGVGLAYLLPDTFRPQGVNELIFALFIGVALCVSAIPVMAKTLMDMNLMHRRVGQISLSAGVVDDIFGWMMLSVVAAMVTTGSVQPGKVLQSLMWVVLAVAFAATAGRFIIRRTLELARRAEGDAPAVTAMTAIIMASAGATHAMGLEAALGAFLCGVIIGRDVEFKQIKLPTIMAVLAPIFFVTAGLRMDLSGLAQWDTFLAGLAVLAVAIAGKFIGVFIGAKLGRINTWESLAMGAAMNARGVIEIIIATVGVQLGVLSATAYTVIVLVAVVTSLMASPILRFTMNRVAPRDDEDDPNAAIAESKELITSPTEAR